MIIGEGMNNLFFIILNILHIIVIVGGVLTKA